MPNKFVPNFVPRKTDESPTQKTLEEIEFRINVLEFEGDLSLSELEELDQMRRDLAFLKVIAGAFG